MAYTTDRTWVTGEIATAAYFNTYLRDNVKWLSTDKPMCNAYHSSTQSISSGSATACSLNSERFDNSTMHDPSSSNSRITIIAANAGRYLVGGNMEWAPSTAGDYRAAIIRADGATSLAHDLKPPGGTSGFATHSPSTLYALNAQYIELVAQQNSGGGLNVTAASATSSYQCTLWAAWVGVG